MPLKRERSALETSSQTSEASSYSAPNGVMLHSGSNRSTTSSSDFGPVNTLSRRLVGFFSALSPSRKRQKLSTPRDTHAHSDVTSTTMLSSDASSPSTPASGFLDLTPSTAASTATTTIQDTPSLLPSQEGAIRDPLGRTLLDSSPSTATAEITNVRQSSEEAAEKQIHHTSPPSSPTLPTKVADLDPESAPVHALEQGSAPEDMSISGSQPEPPIEDNDTISNETLPTDADVDQIQAIAHAKVGERVEGLLDWTGSLRQDELQQPSAPASDAGLDYTSLVQGQTDAPSGHDAAEVVDLVSDSEDGDSNKDDPDKENAMSLVSATPRLDSTAVLAPLASEDLFQEPSRNFRPRGSLVGPLAQTVQRQRRQTIQPQFSTHFLEPAADSSESGNTSAIEAIRTVGRQTLFNQPNRQIVPHSSTPSQSARKSGRDRSWSFGSNASIPSVSAVSSMTVDSSYRKRNPIYRKQHVKAVGAHQQLTIARAIENALQKINQVRRSRRRPLVGPKQFHELATKTYNVHKLVAQDNDKDATQFEIYDQMTQRFLRRKQRDAETAILPLPPTKLLERERLRREEKAKLRRLRGILGRKELPDDLGAEREEAASAVFRKRGQVSEITGAGVSDMDVQKLRPKQWLNDEVINFYGALILNRANEADKKRTEAMAATKDVTVEPQASSKASQSGKGKPKRPYDESLDAFWRVHFFNSFFWANLKSKGFDGVKRWTRRIDIFSKDIVLFPINLGNQHWVCGAINMRKHRFEYYDSLGAPNDAAFTLMRRYLTDEARDKKKKEIDLRGWKDLFSDDSPQQENGYDCGVFAAQTLEQISRRDPHTPIPLDAPSIVWKGESLDEGAGKLNISGAEADDSDDDEEYEWNFGQQNMPYLRRRMAYEIYSKQLLD